jgi:hypothetical protein
VADVLEIITGVEAPGATAGVVLKDNGEADSPATVGVGRLTVQLIAVVVPEIRVATTFGVVLWPAVMLALVGLQATE